MYCFSELGSSQRAKPTGIFKAVGLRRSTGHTVGMGELGLGLGSQQTTEINASSCRSRAREQHKKVASLGSGVGVTEQSGNLSRPSGDTGATVELQLRWGQDPRSKGRGKPLLFPSSQPRLCCQGLSARLRLQSQQSQQGSPRRDPGQSRGEQVGWLSGQTGPGPAQNSLTFVHVFQKKRKRDLSPKHCWHKTSPALVSSARQGSWATRP